MCLLNVWQEALSFWRIRWSDIPKTALVKLDFILCQSLRESIYMRARFVYDSGEVKRMLCIRLGWPGQR